MRKKIFKNSTKYELEKNYDLPTIVTSKKDILEFEAIKGMPNYVCRNKIIGKVKYIKSYNKINNDLKNKIILIESADPGFDWIFNKKISGLITKFGGANSHMAIRASELNIPAAIGVGDLRFNEIKESVIIKLEPLNKILRIIKWKILL